MEPSYPTARELLKMPREVQDAYLKAAAADAAPLYNADLALPPAERELTAFTILDGEPIYEYEDEDNNPEQFDEKQPIANSISLHDNRVLSYIVECEQRRITLHTASEEKKQAERTSVIFSEVAAYHFEGGDFDTIIFDIASMPLEEIYDSNLDVFERRKPYGWLVFDYRTRAELLEKLREREIQGFVLSSSYGMDGFVLAREMRVETTR